jgi:glycosyltransferase involved in cell wall biosynthesis
MNVLVVTPSLYNTSPGPRYRIEQWARYLERDGFRFTFAPFEDAALNRILYQRGHYVRKAALMLRALGRRFQLLPEAGRHDVIFIHREAALIGPAFFERLLARRRVPVIYDFDDAIWVRYASPANSYFSYLKFFGKTATLCRLSDHVTVGNKYLADYARRYNRNVTIVPTTIDTEQYTVRPSQSNGDGVPTIGWTGSYSTVQHLDTLRGALTRLAREQKFRLQVIGTRQYTLDGVETVVKPWRAATEVVDLHDIDIGVMPLPDDNWSQGKCGCKMLQYMGIGVPVVASPVGVNSEILQHGQNGLVARTEDEWVSMLALLLKDAGLRRTLGEAGRRTLEARYAGSAWAARLGEVMRSLKRTR